MKKYVILMLAALALAPASAFWPFGSSDSDKKKPQRLHVLLAKANELIEEGEDRALEGDAEGALKAYRAALDELARIQRENPERAEKQEFAPLRNKVAAVSAQIDNIRFQQVNRNSHPVVLTDTEELQRKYNEKHGLVQDPPASAPSEDEGSAVASVSAPEQAAPEQAGPAVDAATALSRAAAAIRSSNWPDARRWMEELERIEPNALNTHLLKAMVLVGEGRKVEARAALEKAQRRHPRSYLPPYNLARMALEIENDKESAAEYYALGRSLGGPVDPVLEERTK